MSKWTDSAITRVPKLDAPQTSWWSDPVLLADRAAFQKRLVESELARMNQNPRFGGAKKIHDDGVK